MMKRELKYSGVKWIGEIPSTWKVSKVKYAFIRKNKKAHQENPTILSLARSGVKVRDISTNEGQIAESYYDYNPVEVDDLLLNPMDLYSGANCSLSKVEGVISPAYINLRFKKDISPRYYDYYFKTQYWSMAFFVHGKGISYDNRWTMSAETLFNYFIPLPPYSEQLAIADFLDANCNKIDGLLTDLDSEIKTLIEYKKSIISETVTRGLNHDAPMKQSGLPWVGEIPTHWKVIANKYIMHKKKEIVPIYDGQDILSLSMNGVIVRDLDAGGKMPTSFNGYQRIAPGNLLMCLFDIDVTPRCIGLIKNDGLTSPAYSQFVMDGDAFAPYYYYFYLKMDNDKELVHLSKNMRHSLNEEQFGMIKTIFPPKEEQEEIAAYLDAKCAKIEQAISDKQTQIETLKSYKASLVYEYVTGKKQVI